MASKANGSIPWRVLGWALAAGLLLLPLIAMQFTKEVNWTAADFVFAAVVFGTIGGAFELAARKSGNWSYRGGAAVALLAAFLTLWINGAVGIIGSEDNPANLMFFAVLATAICGSVVARFAASGMAKAMTLAALAEAIVGVITLVGRLGADEPPGVVGIEVLIGFFALLWLISAWLFRKAARS